MSEAYDLLIQGGTLVTPTGTVQGDVAVSQGRIAAIGSLGSVTAAETVNAENLLVLPGAIDTQVHFREPGNEHKEDLATGTAAAVLGGVTTVFEMPNTQPPTTTRERLEEKLDLARGRARCDHAFFVGASTENIQELGELEQVPGCAGVKIFMGSSTGSLLVPDDESIRRVLQSGSRRVAVHCEDEDRLNERASMLEGEVTVHQHPAWRDETVALKATRRLVTLAQETGRPAHVLHITSAEEMEFLREQKGGLITVETTPQHLTLSAPDCYDRLGTYAQMNPPIREKRHREALWQAVCDGTVDVIGSDHAPHTREEKDTPYPGSPAGMPGVQTLLPILLDHVHEGRMDMERLVALTAGTPAKIYGISRKGRLEVGYDADITLVDASTRRTITDDWIASRCGWTPFHGREVHGWPVATYLRGHAVMRDDELLGDPLGRPVTFDRS